MITRAELIQDRDLCYDRALGCLAGLAVGDTLGELGRSDYHRQRYGIVTDLDGDSQSTDDTEFALLTAEIVLQSNGRVDEETVYQAWMKHIVEEGIHGRAGQVAHGARENLLRGTRPPLSGQDNCAFYDDGAAMRVAPIGIICAGDPERAARLAEVEARISHAKDGIWAAQAVAASIAVAMVDGSIDEIVAAGLAQIPEDSWLGRFMARAMRICDEAGSLEKAWVPLHDELRTAAHSASPEALSQIYAIFRLVGERGFQESVIAASNFGRDADTLGAVVGALCGAKYGARAIPAGWIETIRQPRGVCLPFTARMDIVRVAERLAGLIGQ